MHGCYNLHRQKSVGSAELHANLGGALLEGYD